MSKIQKNHKRRKRTPKKTPYRLRNWSQYNQALVQRGSLTIWFSEDVLDQWYYQGPKRPKYTTLCRRQKTLSVDLGVARTDQPRHVVIDSTGLKVYGEGEWKVRQHDSSKAVAHPRDEALRYIRRHGRKKWKRDRGYHRRSKVESAMYRFKTIIGSSIWVRTLENQQVEARIKSRVLNRMTALGMPESYAVA